MRPQGFTLIELSIVLVIIGLIVGGVLVGRDLIKAAETRAQLAQIEKFNTAVNTFRAKFGALPGDMPASVATQFGFITRGASAGMGDGNGVIAGTVGAWGHVEGAGETATFWVDISSPVAGNLIEGSFTTANETTMAGSDVTTSSIPSIGAYFPQAKIGHGDYVYVFSEGTCVPSCYSTIGINYFGISAVTLIASSSNSGKLTSAPNLPVIQVYHMDKKVDDGFPQSGKVLAMYVSNDPIWPDGTNSLYNPPATAAVPGTTATCMDNGNVSGPKSYSVSSVSNYGNGGNCSAAFQFQ